jgi:membrane-associated protease RseP (regulator of RpoE activity)
MRKLTGTILVSVLLGSAAVCLAAPTKNNAAEPSKQPAKTQPSSAKVEAFLGVGVEPLHRALVSHLLQLLGEGRGILITDVAKGSPAEKMGLMPDDILLSYDDQKVYSPEQLVKLIHNDKAGREVTLKIIRAGKAQSIKGTIGEHRIASMRRPRRGFGTPASARSGEPLTAEQQEEQWRSFDALTLSRLGGERFKAEIKYRNNEGKTDTRSFEGTPDELRSDINRSYSSSCPVVRWGCR